MFFFVLPYPCTKMFWTVFMKDMSSNDFILLWGILLPLIRTILFLHEECVVEFLYEECLSLWLGWFYSYMKNISSNDFIFIKNFLSLLLGWFYSNLKNVLFNDFILINNFYHCYLENFILTWRMYRWMILFL